MCFSLSLKSFLLFSVQDIPEPATTSVKWLMLIPAGTCSNMHLDQWKQNM
jgi:hypothetical protein